MNKSQSKSSVTWPDMWITFAKLRAKWIRSIHRSLNKRTPLSEYCLGMCCYNRWSYKPTRFIHYCDVGTVCCLTEPPSRWNSTTREKHARRHSSLWLKPVHENDFRRRRFGSLNWCKNVYEWGSPRDWMLWRFFAAPIVFWSPHSNVSSSVVAGKVGKGYEWCLTEEHNSVAFSRTSTTRTFPKIRTFSLPTNERTVVSPIYQKSQDNSIPYHFQKFSIPYLFMNQLWSQ